MSNIFGPAGPFMHPDQIFCYNCYTPLVFSLYLPGFKLDFFQTTKDLRFNSC